MPSAGRSLRLDWTEQADDVFARHFTKLTTAQQLSAFWETPLRQLNYYAFHAPSRIAYKSFFITRRNGNTREIEAPNPSLKRIQRLIHESLSKLYRPPKEVHGFVPGCSIVTNAKVHLGRKYVLRLDLEGFFPSIERKRIIGRLRSRPYGISDDISNIIGHLATNEREALPQGSPSSPVIANIMARPLDQKLAQMCRKLRCRYTRYADDITISTNQEEFPVEIARYPKAFGTDEVVIGEVVVDAIEEFGFKVNQSKSRLRDRKSRQMATGLVLNGSKPTPTKDYIRRLRALVYNWERYGWEHAAHKLAQGERRQLIEDAEAFRAHVLGRINYLKMVRGEEDSVAATMLERARAIRVGE